LISSRDLVIELASARREHHTGRTHTTRCGLYTPKHVPVKTLPRHSAEAPGSALTRTGSETGPAAALSEPQSYSESTKIVLKEWRGSHHARDYREHEQRSRTQRGSFTLRCWLMPRWAGTPPFDASPPREDNLCKSLRGVIFIGAGRRCQREAFSIRTDSRPAWSAVSWRAEQADRSRGDDLVHEAL